MLKDVLLVPDQGYLFFQRCTSHQILPPMSYDLNLMY